MRKNFIVFALLFIGIGIAAQPQQRQGSSRDTHQKVFGQILDTLKNPVTTDTGSVNLSSNKKLSLPADTLTASDYMLSIERINDNLNSIRDSAALGFEVVHMSRRIADMTDAIALIRQNLRGRNSAVNIRNLYLYQRFASGLDNENKKIQGHLTKMYHRVYYSKLKLKSVLSDSVFKVIYASSKLKNTYARRLDRLGRKWVRTDSISKASIDTLNVLKVKVADNSMSLSYMLNLMEMRVDRAGRQLFGAEVNNLWQKAHKDKNAVAAQPNKEVSIIGTEKKAIGYYFSQTSRQRTIILILGILLFLWVFTKRNAINTLRNPNNPFEFLKLQYLKSNPFSSLLVVLFCLMPFFDAYAPASYISIEYTLLLLFSSLIFLRTKDLVFQAGWFMLVALFIAEIFSYLLIEPTFAGRFWMLAIHTCIIVSILFFLKKIRKDEPYSKWIAKAAIAGMILTGFSIIFNIFGRFTLSGILGLTGIIAVTQAVVLPIFIETVIEIILLQLQTKRMKKGFGKPFDVSLIVKRIKTPLFLIAVILWLIMLSSNLNIFHALRNGLTGFLTTPVYVGSISFKLINVLFFFVIIWLAHISQQLISFFFGETGIEAEDTTPVTKKQHSRLLIIRLIVLIGGYLLAIAASGLPLDKITILLGALGIGIGMGLQNVVNNFVSGIILIFDGSLQIGDEIEISGQAGKVKEIGLRASILTTADGAEVIIPNGTILSQNIVNWTFTNDQKRVAMWFILSGKEMDSNVINEVINETISNIPGVISQKRPVILYSRVTPENCTLNIRFWSTITNADKAKSEAILKLSAAFKDKNIQFG